MKTGECYFLDEIYELWVAMPYANEDGFTWTEQTKA